MSRAFGRPLLFGICCSMGLEAALKNRSGGAILAAGFFVAEREGCDVSSLRDSMREKQVPSTAPKIRVLGPGFFFTQNAQKAFIHIAFLKVHDATWISLKSPEITMGCTPVAHTLHTDLCTVLLSECGFGKSRLHTFWRITHTARQIRLFCLPGQERVFRCLTRFAVV